MNEAKQQKARWCGIHNCEFVEWPVKLPTGKVVGVMVCVHCQDEKEGTLRMLLKARKQR